MSSGPIESLNDKTKIQVGPAHGHGHPTHFERLLYAINEFAPRVLLK